MLIIFLACLAAFFAGLVDSIAGGGGLIQVPALLFLFPSMPVVTLLGTNKLAASFGTVMSSLHYVRTLKINYRPILPALLAALICSVIGAKIVSIMNDEVLKPLVFILLFAIGIYTFVKKDFGIESRASLASFKNKIYAVLIAAIMGFYDGFFGPGTGSLLMFFFVIIIGFSFLEGSAYSKLINLAANLAAMIFFALHHHILYKVALPMAVFNIAGNYIGARLAIKKGSRFVRWIFLVVICGILFQFIWQMHLSHA